MEIGMGRCLIIMFLVFCRKKDWNEAFNFSSNLDFVANCIQKIGLGGRTPFLLLLFFLLIDV